jgi:ABC-2 type transport system ATP-binding protein
MLRAQNRDLLARALLDSGVTSAPAGIDGLLVNADSARVSQIAFAAGIALLELRAADGAGLEEMFLSLTSATQRDTTVKNRPEGAVA